VRRRSPWLWAAALVAYAFLYVPLAIVVVYSFNDSRLNAEWVGFTLDWYRKLAANEEMLQAAANSLLIGLAASAVATVLGTMAGVAMYRYRLRLLPVLVLTPIAIPEILMGVSLLIFFVLLNVTLGLLSVALAHIAFCIGFVAIVVRSRARSRSSRTATRSRTASSPTSTPTRDPRTRSASPARPASASRALRRRSSVTSAGAIRPSGSSRSTRRARSRTAHSLATASG